MDIKMSTLHYEFEKLIKTSYDNIVQEAYKMIE